MKRIIKLHDPLYCTDILLMWGITKEEFDKELYRRFKIEGGDMFLGSGVYFLADNTAGCDCAVIGIKDTFDGSPYFHALLAHECLHAAFSILGSRGMGFGRKSEEAYTYYLGWMIHNLSEKMTQVELKIADKQ